MRKEIKQNSIKIKTVGEEEILEYDEDTINERHIVITKASLQNVIDTHTAEADRLRPLLARFSK